MDHQTIQLPDFLSTIQVTIQLTDHSAFKLLLAVWLQDMSNNNNKMPTVHWGSESWTSLVFIWLVLECLPDQYLNGGLKNGLTFEYQTSEYRTNKSLLFRCRRYSDPHCTKEFHVLQQGRVERNKNDYSIYLLEMRIRLKPSFFRCN